ncbi:hypothetical protein AMTRI_Chr08g207500 [Amborella trichopoda]
MHLISVYTRFNLSPHSPTPQAISLSSQPDPSSHFPLHLTQKHSLSPRSPTISQHNPPLPLHNSLSLSHAEQPSRSINFSPRIPLSHSRKTQNSIMCSICCALFLFLSFYCDFYVTGVFIRIMYEFCILGVIGFLYFSSDAASTSVFSLYKI